MAFMSATWKRQLALILCITPFSSAQSCISLADSTACPAFNASSISTDQSVTGLFPFLADVTDVASFDSGLTTYIYSRFAAVKYRNLLGCSSFTPGNTTEFYARYTASVLCNAIVQNSIQACDLTGDATRPLCADSCAEYAESEQRIVASNFCGSSNSDALSQIRADLTNCALPADSLTVSCIPAVENQPNFCGYDNNTAGLCGYCAASSPNATDSCCVFSKSESLCQDVQLPIVASSALQPITMTAFVTQTETPTGEPSSPTSSSLTGAAYVGHNLTGGDIAGIVVGSVLGAALLLALIIGGCLLFKRRQGASPPTSVFNQPATMEQQPQMAYNDGVRDGPDFLGVGIPQGRVARMSALEGSSPSDRYIGAYGYKSSTSDADTSPRSQQMLGVSPPGMRNTSLSSGSPVAAGGVDASPSSNGDYASPDSRGHSEQLAFFKDYYSQDEIHPGDLVSTLWAYEPRAGDEFHLERGDMIKVLGIWDDGWATGVRVKQRAEDWRSSGQRQRDSGHTSVSSRPPPDTGDGEVKAFPLVCVCLPQHWRKTIEGDSTGGS